MTLEEAKKEIAGRKAMYDSIVDRISDPYNTARDFYKGEASGLSEAVDILAKVYTEPVVKDKLTLTELAHKLKKIFYFRWLTVDEGNEIQLWVCFSENDPPEFYEDGCWYADSPMTDELCSILSSMGFFAIDIDLSEYKDTDGNIDYSKCIVEVTDASE